TFDALNRRANRLAHVLRTRGVDRGVLVGLCVERTLELLVGLLGILKAGGAYVPLDPAYPKDRLGFMIIDSGMPLLVTDSRIAPTLPPHGARVLCMDTDPDVAAGERESNLAVDVRPDDPAYVIYTSGSTGKPKGVQVPHRAVANFLTSMAREPGMGPDDVVLAVTTLSFDIAVLELHLPMSVGAKIILASREMAGDGALLLQALKREAVTVMQATPSTWRLLLGAGFAGEGRLKILCGGEPLPRDLAEQLVPKVHSLWNMYGPTETTVWSTVQRITLPLGVITIGRPIANTQIYVLDAHGAPMPIGVPGELFIGGDGVTLGYLNRPELTAERFVADPFRGGEARMYKTGDMARWLGDGSIEFLGRNDHQVKLRGFRIELGEIEAALASFPAVRQAAALVREDRPGDVRLVAYLVLRSEEEYTDTMMRKHLRGSLPEYMVPQHFVELESLPLTPNGKIDRKALPPPFSAASLAADTFEAPAGASEILLAGIWQVVLGLPRVSRSDNFFDLGGHSLLCLQVIGRVEERTGVRLSPRLFLLSTLQQVASQLPASVAEPAVAAPARPAMPATSTPEPQSSPLPFAQRMLQRLRDRIR
ncbi:MAG TPA: amino acid adenylation domain-containing protein, partial [Myxococcota bacterium]|nr:amino acid adenylation domain-containing protein [Myxococcota bacterium]